MSELTLRETAGRSLIAHRGTAGWHNDAMAADSSFDVVSKVDRQEVDNALNQAAKEVHQRFDLLRFIQSDEVRYKSSAPSL